MKIIIILILIIYVLELKYEMEICILLTNVHILKLESTYLRNYLNKYKKKK